MSSEEPRRRLSDQVSAFDAVQEGVNIAGIALVGMSRGLCNVLCNGPCN